MTVTSFLRPALAALMLAALMLAPARAADPENTLYMELEDGRVVIELLPARAPHHVQRIKQLVRDGFYDGVVFHRVIPGFMAQTGDPTGTGTGGSDMPDLRAEFTDMPFERGTLGMARTSDPDSANSQFFIVYDRAQHLDGQYTAFGRVIEGMELVDAIKKGAGRSGMVTDPDRIVKVQVAADAQ